jgi:ribonuclease Z
MAQSVSKDEAVMQKRYLVLIIILLVVIVGFSQRDKLVTRLLQVGIDRQFSTTTLGSLGDGLHVGLCGAGSPLPAPKASGPCVAVAAGAALYVVDVGTDSPRNLARMGWAAAALEGVFITHFHSDHIDGLGELMTLRWAGGSFESPLPVYGPSGIERVVNGFNEAYAQDFIYRQAHHGDAVTPLKSAGGAAKPFPKPAPGQTATLVDRDGLKIEAFSVTHSPVEPAVGYRFTYKGRTVVISGDTIKDQNIVDMSRGADLLVHEALAANLVALLNEGARKNGQEVMAAITHDIPDYHATPMDAAETAEEAGVGHLLYYHIVPALLIPGQERLFLNGAQDVFPNFTIGYDGVAFTLPPDSDDIIQISDGL